MKYMSKQILLETEARNRVSEGIDIASNAVKKTLGPAGSNAILENQFGLMVSNDGLTVIKDLELEDKFQNLGVKLIRQVAEKTDSGAKGGRTTAVTLAQELIKEGRKYIEVGVNPIKIRTGMGIALKDAISDIKKQAKKITTEKEVAQVASISSESKEMGDLIAKVVMKVGKDGVVNVEGSNSTETTHSTVRGFQFDKGYISPYFVNNDKGEAVLNDCLVLISDKKISNGKDAVEFIEKILQSGEKNLLIICEDLADQALATFVVNRMQGVINVVAVKSPEWGDWQKKVLQDIAILTGTKVLSDESGIKMSDLEIGSLGRLDKVVVTKDKTTLMGGSKNIGGRITMLKYELFKEKDVVEKERLQHRIAKLSNGVAIINVGAPSEAEMVYKKQKTDDGVNDAQSALEEGVVCGGGVALAKVSLTGKNKDKDVQAGYEIVKNALSIQLKQIVANTGESGDVVLAKVRENVKEGKKNYGYDAKNECYVEDMFKAGIVDSAKVTRMVLENAVSVASIALTVSVAITEKEKEQVNSQGQKV